MRAMRPAAPAMALFGVGLFRRRCLIEGGNRHTGIVNAHYPLIGFETDLEHLGWEDLSGETDVGEAGRIAVAELAAFLVLRQKRFHRLKPKFDPMLDPGQALRVRDFEGLSQVVADARHEQRM